MCDWDLVPGETHQPAQLFTLFSSFWMVRFPAFRACCSASSSFRVRSLRFCSWFFLIFSRWELRSCSWRSSSHSRVAWRKTHLSIHWQNSNLCHAFYPCALSFVSSHLHQSQPFWLSRPQSGTLRSALRAHWTVGWGRPPVFSSGWSDFGSRLREIE